MYSSNFPFAVRIPATLTTGPSVYGRSSARTLILVDAKQTKAAYAANRCLVDMVGSCVNSIGLDAAAYGTHSRRRTKATIDLSADQKSPSCSAAARPHETRKHS